MATTKKPKKAVAGAAEPVKPAAKAPRKKKAAKAEPEPVAKELPEELPEDEVPVAAIEEEEDADFAAEEEEPAPAPKPAKGPPGRKPAAPEAEGPQAVASARRLTPEAKAALNAMLARGVPLSEALKQTARWETFTAPVREPAPSRFEGMMGRSSGRSEGGGGGDFEESSGGSPAGGDFEEEPVTETTDD